MKYKTQYEGSLVVGVHNYKVNYLVTCVSRVMNVTRENAHYLIFSTYNDTEIIEIVKMYQNGIRRYKADTVTIYLKSKSGEFTHMDFDNVSDAEHTWDTLIRVEGVNMRMVVNGKTVRERRVSNA